MKYFFLTVAAISISISTFSQTGNTVSDTLPAPFATKSIKNFSNVIGWSNDETPQAPPGFTVTKYADGLINPRNIYVLPNGDVLISEANTINTTVKKVGAELIGAAKAENMGGSANRITLLRDTKGTGSADMKVVFLEGLEQPFGILLLNDWLYVANTSSLIRYRYKTGMTHIDSKGEKIMDLPAGKHNRHWTRDIITNADQSKIYVAVGSGSDHSEDGIANEILRANIIEINPDGSGMKVYASGIRNPAAIAWMPGTNVLWAAVNERDELGDNLVPDYFTSVKRNGFYGWPYSYWGQHVDPRVKERKSELVKKAIIPDISLGDHTAPLGLLFYTKKAFPEKYRNGAFITEHGSWNRSVLNGYKVVFIPFSNGKPSGLIEDFLTGFIADIGSNKVHGRPVGITEMPDGSMLVADDVNNTIWRIAAR